ncbi:MAG: DUF4351 domain-containing protein [Anaerolineae bacterium]
MPYITSVERMGMQRGLEQGIQQGIQQGAQQGVQQGVQQGQAEMVLRVLNRRFGMISADLTASICGLPSPHLPILLDVALSAEALPEVAAVVTTLIANTDKVNPSPM